MHSRMLRQMFLWFLSDHHNFHFTFQHKIGLDGFVILFFNWLTDKNLLDIWNITLFPGFGSLTLLKEIHGHWQGWDGYISPAHLHPSPAQLMHFVLRNVIWKRRLLTGNAAGSPDPWYTINKICWASNSGPKFNIGFQNLKKINK